MVHPSFREAGRLALVDGLAVDLKAVTWGSADMGRTINQYLIGLTRTTATGVIARISGLFNLGLDAAGSPGTALQLAALQGLSNVAWEDTVREVWEKANDKTAPPGPGYVHFQGEVLLDTLRRLKGEKEK